MDKHLTKRYKDLRAIIATMRRHLTAEQCEDNIEFLLIETQFDAVADVLNLPGLEALEIELAERQGDDPTLRLN